jgi:hypothetical protein
VKRSSTRCIKCTNIFANKGQNVIMDMFLFWYSVQTKNSRLFSILSPA